MDGNGVSPILVNYPYTVIDGNYVSTQPSEPILQYIIAGPTYLNFYVPTMVGNMHRPILLQNVNYPIH
jgi:hypothetical protein